MHGGRKYGREICGVKYSRRPRHTRGYGVEEEDDISQLMMKKTISRNI